MKRGSESREQQTKWLRIVPRIAAILIHRRALILSVSPAILTTDQEGEKTRRKIEEVGAELNDLVGELEGLEQEEDGLGSAALLGGVESIRRPIRVSVAVLVMARLIPSVGEGMRTVGELAELVGGEDLAAVLEVRRGFEQDGELRPFVHCRKSVVRDEWQVMMTEEALALALGLEPDEEAVGMSLMFRESWDASTICPASAPPLFRRLHLRLFK